jgi:hypothetical protein
LPFYHTYFLRHIKYNKIKKRKGKKVISIINSYDYKAVGGGTKLNN